MYTFLLGSNFVECSGQYLTDYVGVLIPEKKTGPLEHKFMKKKVWKGHNTVL